MSKVKLNENLFIGVQELQRIIDFLEDEGFRLAFQENTLEYGLINNVSDGALINGRIEAGTNPGTIKYNQIRAFDSNMRYINIPSNDNLAIEADGLWYWVKISYQTTNKENGTVSIDSDGNLTGTNTNFTEILRGQPKHPSVIRFLDSVQNQEDYEVVDVVDDTTIILAGEFNAETDLSYGVVGTFDPIAQNPSHKMIFDRDGGALSLNVEPAPNQAPAKVEGEYFLARVKLEGGQIIIEDKRTEFWRSKADFNFNRIDTETNPLIGVELIKYDDVASTRIKNQVQVAWGFRTTNWEINTSLNTFTALDGEGGRFKSANDFADGNFDGWRLYTEDGKYSIISSSVKAGTSFNLVLDTLDPERFSNNSQEVIIVPNVEEIEIIAKADPDDNTDLPNQDFVFPINKGFERVHLIAYKELAKYNLQYRYKNQWSYSQLLTPLNDTTIGYYDETSFDDNGVLNPDSEDRNRKLYTADATAAYIELIQNPSSYSKFVNAVDLNDLRGCLFIDDLEAEVAPIANRRLDLIPGTTKQHVTILGSAALTGAVRFNLSTTGAKTGTEFFLNLATALDNTTNEFDVSFYVDNTTEILTLTQKQISKGNQFYKCVYDTSNTNGWKIIAFDNDYDGRNTSNIGIEVVNTTDNVEVVDTKNVLVVSGFYDHIMIHNSASINLDAIRFRNKVRFNTIKLSSGLNGDTFIRLNPNNAPDSDADNTYIQFLGDLGSFYPDTVAPNQLLVDKFETVVLAFQTLEATEDSNIVGPPSSNQGYKPIYYSDMVSDLRTTRDRGEEIRDWINDIIIAEIPLPDENLVQGAEETLGIYTTPNDGIERKWIVFAKAICNRLDVGRNDEFVVPTCAISIEKETAPSSGIYDVVDISRAEQGTVKDPGINGALADIKTNWDATLSAVYSATIDPQIRIRTRGLSQFENFRLESVKFILYGIPTSIIS